MSKFLKLLIGFGLLAVLFSNSKFDQILEAFKHINYLFCSLSLPLYIFNTYLSSYRWWLLIPQANYFQLLRSNFMLAYYMVFVPGQLVSEGIKGARLVASGNKSQTVFTSIFIDKLIAFIALMLVGIVGLSFSRHQSMAFNSVMSLLATLLLTLLILLFFGSKAFKLIEWFGHLPIFKSLAWVKKLLTVIETYFSEYSSILKTQRINTFYALLVSFLFQSGCILTNYIIASSLDIHIALWDWAWMTALLAVVLLLPISIGGIGVREGGLAAMFALLGLPVEQALSFSLVIYAFTFISALIGYLVDLFFGLQAKAA